MAMVFAVMVAVLASAGVRAAPPGGDGGSACGTADSRIAFSWMDSARTVYAVNPDGGCLVQLTNGGQDVPMSWTADDHLLTQQALLSVPDSTDPTSVSTVYSYSREFDDISQHRNASGVLPATQQLLVATAADGINIEVCTANGATCTQLTNYVNTYDGSDGIEYIIRIGRWLPASPDLSRIRLTYHYVWVERVAGEVVDHEIGQRAITLSTAGWPAITTNGMTDKWIGGNDLLLSGIAFGEYSLVKYSRDGTTAALRGAYGDGIYTVPLVYDEIDNEVTADVANAVQAASGVPENIYHDIALSPDNSQIGYNANHLIEKGKNKGWRTSIWVIGATAQTGSVEVDGSDAGGMCCTVWGPSSGGSTPPTATPTDPPEPPTATPPPAGGDMHVGDLDGVGSNHGSRWRANVTITVHDDNEDPVAGATVSGAWTAGASGSASCTTDAAGSCTVSSAKVKKSQVSSITYAVTGANHGSLSYAAGGNHDAESDSDGTTIVVNKP